MDARVAYLAGLVDGEGCFCISEPADNVCRSTLSIRMNDSRTIKWIHQNFGGSVSKCKPKYDANQEAGFFWMLAKKSDLARLLTELLNHLITKKSNAVVMLEFLQKFPSQVGAYTADQKDSMKRYAAIMKALNSTGIGSNELKAKFSVV